MSRFSITDIRERKGKEKLAVLTAYTAPFARALDEHADILLVGDSLGMVLYAMPSTLGVTLDMMIAHGAAVVRSSKRACVVVDMPFGSYQQSPAQAFESCARVLAETGCQGVKLEGGEEMAPTIRFLVERGIPVMGHVGLMPQHFNALGGFRSQGRKAAEKDRILKDARAIDAAGVFAFVIEGVMETVANEIVAKATVPTIGIGASAACDGQVLVTEDILGFNESPPRFVKIYGNLGQSISHAASAFASDVRSGRFPTKENTYN